MKTKVAPLIRNANIQDEAAESSEPVRQALNHMMEGCLIIGFDWRILFVNDASVRRGMRARDELLGRTLLELDPSIEGTKFFKVCQRCMDDRVPERMENEYIYDGTGVWFDTSVQPVAEGIVVLSLDISKQKHAEEALRTTKENLEAKVGRQFLRRNPYDLTFRELTVLHLVAEGESDRQIALMLGISLRTAQQHVSKILSKMNVRSRTKAGVRAIRIGLLSQNETY